MYHSIIHSFILCYVFSFGRLFFFSGKDTLSPEGRRFNRLQDAAIRTSSLRLPSRKPRPLAASSDPKEVRSPQRRSRAAQVFSVLTWRPKRAVPRRFSGPRATKETCWCKESSRQQHNVGRKDKRFLTKTFPIPARVLTGKGTRYQLVAVGIERQGSALEGVGFILLFRHGTRDPAILFLFSVSSFVSGLVALCSGLISWTT